MNEKTAQVPSNGSLLEVFSGWAGMSMLISGCQRCGKRSIAILNVPCRGSICQCLQCPRLVGAVAAGRTAPPVVVQWEERGGEREREETPAWRPRQPSFGL